MDNFVQIPKEEVWKHLEAGEAVWAVILGKRGAYNQGVKEIWTGWSIQEILRLMRGKDTDFYIRKPEEEITREEGTLDD